MEYEEHATVKLTPDPPEGPAETMQFMKTPPRRYAACRWVDHIDAEHMVTLRYERPLVAPGFCIGDRGWAYGNGTKRFVAKNETVGMNAHGDPGQFPVRFMGKMCVQADMDCLMTEMNTLHQAAIDYKTAQHEKAWQTITLHQKNYAQHQWEHTALLKDDQNVLRAQGESLKDEVRRMHATAGLLFFWAVSASLITVVLALRIRGTL